MKRSLFHSAGKPARSSNGDQRSILVQTVSDLVVTLSNACVFVPTWCPEPSYSAEPGLSLWHCKANDGVEVAGVACDGAQVGKEVSKDVGAEAPILATDPADYVVLD